MFNDKGGIMLTSYAQETLDRRLAAGRRAIDAFNTDGEDDDTAAKDLVSDILTALFGPAGTLVDDGKCRGVKDNDDACDNARAFVDAALQSYFGDAEDYVEEVEEEPAPEPPITDLVVLHLGDSGWLIVTS